MVCEERPDGRGDGSDREDVHDRQAARAKKTLETQTHPTLLRLLLSRKFLLALIVIAIASFGLFFKFLDGGTWVAAVSIAAGMYGGANIVQRRFERPRYDVTDQLED